MKKFIVNNCMNYIKRYTNYDKTKLLEIQYGLEAIYITFTKFIIISIIAIYLGLFKEFLTFTLIYNGLRLFSFGLHATKSWICLLSSLIIFINIPLICNIVIIPLIIKICILILGIIFMFKNSPADTYKKPIIKKSRRDRYKFVSTIITIIYSFLAIFMSNNFISNCVLFSIILQNCLIAPTTYKIFKLPYDNFKTYLINHPEMAQ